MLFKSFTGLTVKEFDDIFKKEIAKRYGKHEIQRLSKRKERERSIGAGRHFKLNIKNRFMMLLVYYRLYITYTLTGFLFDLDQSNICRDIQKTEPLVRKCVPIPQKIYNRLSKRLQTPSEVEKYFPGFIAFVDCTEQQIPRPKNKIRRRAYFSGKRKMHTVKTQLMVNSQGIITHKTNHKKGRRHDYSIYKKNHPVISKEVVNVFDLGYLGVEKDFSDQKSYLPNRKKRNQKEMPTEGKEYNQSHSKKRIVIEHTICKVKKYKILADIFRNRLRKYNGISDIVSGLVNYRMINHHN
jgi:hypothetical protein